MIDKTIIVRNKSGYVAQIGIKWFDATRNSKEERFTLNALQKKTFVLPQSQEAILFGNAVFGTPSVHMVDLITANEVNVCIDLYGN